ncbi:MAG: hypothetical protein V2I33_08530 [Kangiellaceae bacterium]|jgi:hypothetical protein|nr:hypothetical protein [Kangiellaceae bacterium]
MKKLMIVTKCTGTNGLFASFHFDGHVEGNKVNGIGLHNKGKMFTEDRSYLIHLENCYIEYGVLSGKVVKVKEI